LAAEIRAATPHLFSVAFDLLLHRELRTHYLNRKRVAFHHLLAETNRLLEEESRIQGENPHPVRDAREHIQEDHPLWVSEGDRERELLPVNPDRPAQDVLRRPTLQLFGRA